MKNRLNNKILIPLAAVVLCALVAVLYFVTEGLTDAPEGDYIKISRGNKVIERINPEDVGSAYTLDLETNKILVEPDGVSVTSASCPDKVCVKQGKISSPGEAIICLPNRIMIEFCGKSDETDAVAGAR